MVLSIEERIELGEDTLTEFKSVRVKDSKLIAPRQNDIADEIAAFANSSRGGTIYFGVSDDKKIEGIDADILPQLETLIRSACIDSVEPPLASANTIHRKLKNHLGETKFIIELQIEPSVFVHNSPGGYYHRICDAKTKMKSDFLARLFQIRSQAKVKCFDEFPIASAHKKDLNLIKIKKFFDPSLKKLTDTMLSKSRLLVETEDGKLVPSVAAILLFGNEPQEYFRNAVIECVAFRGNEQNSDNQVDGKQIDGPLFSQIDESYIFVLKNMSVRAKKTPYRVETPQFSDKAVFEAIVNAVAHRDYSIYGSKIRIFLFDNRLEIKVPGNLPNSVTENSLDVRQFTRNELISRFLGKSSPQNSWIKVQKKYMETRGDGVPLILKESFKLSGKMPEYKLIQDELHLTIWSS